MHFLSETWCVSLACDTKVLRVVELIQTEAKSSPPCTQTWSYLEVEYAFYRATTISITGCQPRVKLNHKTSIAQRFAVESYLNFFITRCKSILENYSISCLMCGCGAMVSSDLISNLISVPLKSMTKNLTSLVSSIKRFKRATIAAGRSGVISFSFTHPTPHNLQHNEPWFMSCHFFFKQEKRRHEATTLRAAARPWSFSESLWKCAEILSFTSVNSTRAEYAQDAELHVFVCWTTRRTTNIHTSSSFVVGCAAKCKLRYKKSCLTLRPTLASIHYSNIQAVHHIAGYDQPTSLWPIQSVGFYHTMKENMNKSNHAISWAGKRICCL